MIEDKTSLPEKEQIEKSDLLTEPDHDLENNSETPAGEYPEEMTDPVHHAVENDIAQDIAEDNTVQNAVEDDIVQDAVEDDIVQDVVKDDIVQEAVKDDIVQVLVTEIETGAPEVNIDSSTHEEEDVNVVNTESKQELSVQITDGVVEPAVDATGGIDESNLSGCVEEGTTEIADHSDDEEEEEDDFGDESEEKYEGLGREELVHLLEETVKDTDIGKIKTRVAMIKVAYLKATRELHDKNLEDTLSSEETEIESEVDQLEERFNQAFSVYRQNKLSFLEDQEKVKERNLETKLQILEELKELINSEETLKRTYDEFKILQDRWKEIGMVPRTEVNNLWQSYHFLVEKFFDKVKINKELRDLDLKKNLESKVELCEKAEELLIESSIIKSFKELQKLHEKWKEIGPVPVDKKDEIWDRFKLATDKINDRRREHYSQLSEQQNRNYEAKTSLCEKAEELLAVKNQNMKDWQETTKQINELFKVWRSIGPATKKYNDEIWNRFKLSLNTFFENRREYFNQVKDQQLNNYNIKLDLCVQAEALQESTDWKSSSDELIRLQKEWKRIGPVPRKYSDKVWKRFRAANDNFFNRKAEYFSNIHEHENINLEEKKALIEKVKCFEFGKDRAENLKVIKEFQRTWMEIGHVPIKDKDWLQKEFRDAIDAQLDKLRISPVEVSSINFRTKIDAIKEEPNSQRVLSKEKNFLSNKISKLREDINLWENNVGFLASSKKADILKEEFNKKIEKAKQELKAMEAKLKYLVSQRD